MSFSKTQNLSSIDMCRFCDCLPSDQQDDDTTERKAYLRLLNPYDASSSVSSS